MSPTVASQKGDAHALQVAHHDRVGRRTEWRRHPDARDARQALHLIQPAAANNPEEGCPDRSHGDRFQICPLMPCAAVGTTTPPPIPPGHPLLLPLQWVM